MEDTKLVIYAWGVVVTKISDILQEIIKKEQIWKQILQIKVKTLRQNMKWKKPAKQAS